MVPADDQAIALPCASVIVIMVLLNVALTCATPEAIFLRSRFLTRASLPIPQTLSRIGTGSRHRHSFLLRQPDSGRRENYFFLPAIAFAGPLRVRALVWVR